MGRKPVRVQIPPPVPNAMPKRGIQVVDGILFKQSKQPKFTFEKEF